jgi:hypothetical protein
MTIKEDIEERIKNGKLVSLKEYGVNLDYLKMADEIQALHDEAENFPEGRERSKIYVEYFNDTASRIFKDLETSSLNQKDKIKSFAKFKEQILEVEDVLESPYGSIAQNMLEDQIRYYDKLMKSADKKSIEDEVQSITEMQEKKAQAKGDPDKEFELRRIYTNKFFEKDRSFKAESLREGKPILDIRSSGQTLKTSSEFFSGVDSRSKNLDSMLSILDENRLKAENIDTTTKEGIDALQKVNNLVLEKAIPILSQMELIHDKMRKGFHPIDSYKESRRIKKAYEKMSKTFGMSKEDLKTLVDNYSAKDKGFNIEKGYLPTLDTLENFNLSLYAPVKRENAMTEEAKSKISVKLDDPPVKKSPSVVSKAEVVKDLKKNN